MPEIINKYARDEEYELPEYKKISEEMLKIFKATTKIDLKLLENNEQYVNGMGFSRYWEYPWAIINSKVDKNMIVLDVGCGKAPFIKYLGKVIGCETYGVDYGGYGIIDDGTWGCDEGHNKKYNYTVKKADVREKLPFPDEMFDRVFCINVIERMNSDDEVRRAVKEMVRVLKAGGLLIINLADGLYHKEIEKVGLPYYGECDFSLPKHKKPYNVLGLIFQKPGSTEGEKKSKLRKKLINIRGIDEKIADEILEEYISLDGIKKAIKEKTFAVGGVGKVKQQKMLKLRN